jgi:hypothetical protein
VLDPNRIKTKVQLYKEEPAAKGTVAFVCIFTRQQYLRSTCICSPPRVPLHGPVRRNRPRQQISDTYKRRDWEPCSSSNGGKGTVATLAADKNGQAVGPRATCDIKGASRGTLLFVCASLHFRAACVIALEPSFPLCAPAVTKLRAGMSRDSCPATLN